MFTDESRVNISRESVYRRKGERFVDTCDLQKNWFWGRGIMVWGGILGARRIVVHGNWNAQGYINQIVLHETVPFIQSQQHQVNTQQVNAQPHTAGVT